MRQPGDTRQWGDAIKEEAVRAAIIHTGGCIRLMCMQFGCSRQYMLKRVRRLGLYELMIEQRRVANGNDYESIRTIIVRAKGNIRRMSVLSGKGYKNRRMMLEWVRRLGLFDLLLEHRRLAKQARQKARLDWLKKAEQELCNGSDDSIDGGSLSRAISGKDFW